jgi:DnaK suppressor protein
MKNEKELAELKEKLLGEREKIEKRLEELKKSPDFGDDTDSFEEEADETEELTDQIEIKSSLEGHLENIGEALDKMKSGTYGICETCGKEISHSLLEIAPESKQCQVCKEKEK